MEYGKNCQKLEIIFLRDMSNNYCKNKWRDVTMERPSTGKKMRAEVINVEIVSFDTLMGLFETFPKKNSLSLMIGLVWEMLLQIKNIKLSSFFIKINIA